MLLTLSTTHQPATDLGYLLVKHPDRVHEFDLSSLGTAYVCFPESSPQRCTAALIMDVDPGRQGQQRPGARDGRAAWLGSLGRYVNDRPYAASSLLAAALNRAFRSALRGESRERPELAATAIPLTVRIPALRCRGGAPLADRLLTPLGWEVHATTVPLDPTRPEWGGSRYLDLTMSGTLRLADALNQLYVLMPVFDDAKHYWVAPDEVDKLLRAGAGWLAEHPARELITARYLRHRRALTSEATARLETLRAADDADQDTVEGADPAAIADEDAELPPEPVAAAGGPPVPLAQLRREAVRAELGRSGATRVLDLGCGSGALIADLVRDKRFSEIVGVDVSPAALELAHRRLGLDRSPERQRGRVRLLQSALTYADDRLAGFDAAVLMEVIEHVDAPRLPALASAVFSHARPSTVVVTTPNIEYNVRYRLAEHPGSGEPSPTLRHHDHRFEWSRAEFAAWCGAVAARYGYQVRITGVGEEDPDLGHPTQLATFARAGQHINGAGGQVRREAG